VRLVKGLDTAVWLNVSCYAKVGFDDEGEVGFRNCFQRRVHCFCTKYLLLSSADTPFATRVDALP
jgi:hypothetical protein